MQRKNKPKLSKCPRCGLLSPSQTPECPDCGLIFERLNMATNKDAKKKKLRGDREFIINTKKLPNDVSYIKLLLMAIFFGIFGGHCYYVGRYLRGIVFTLNIVFAIFLVIFNGYFLSLWYGLFMEFAAPIVGIITFMWLWDIMMIALKKFKVPVAIDLKEVAE